MNEQEIVERVKTGIVKVITQGMFDTGRVEHWDDAWDWANQILSIEGLEICYEAELPKLQCLIGDASMAEKSAYVLGVSDMGEKVKSAGWRKVIG